VETVLEVSDVTYVQGKSLSLPMTGLSSRGAYAYVTLSTVSVKVVISLAKAFSAHTYSQIKDNSHDDPKSLAQELLALSKDPDANFIPAIWWIYKLLEEGWVDRFKNDGYKLESHETESEFLFKILIFHPEEFLSAIAQMNNEELSKGRSFYMFPLKPGETPVLQPNFALPMSKINEFGVIHSEKQGCGKHFVASTFKTEDMIGLRIERSTHRKNAPKIDAAEIAKAVTQRDVREDIILLHIPSQTIWVSCPPGEKLFCLTLVEMAIAGSAGKFGTQRKFKMGFLKDDDLDGVLSSSIVGIAKNICLKQVRFVKAGLQPKDETFKVFSKKRSDTLSDVDYRDFQEARMLYNGAKMIKLQIELIAEQRLFDTIYIYEDRVVFGQHLSEDHALAILYKLNVLERYTNA
jgi:hypothetical protein